MKMKRCKSNDDYPEYSRLRADLLDDHKPANAREFLLVTEIAREREAGYHSLTRWIEADRQPTKFDQAGVETVGFLHERLEAKKSKPQSTG